MKKHFYLFVLSFLAACTNGNDNGNNDGNEPRPDGPKSISYSIISTYPHDTSSFTEGMTVYKGSMYEGTGNLVKRAEKMKELGAKTTKTLPTNLIERSEEEK